MQSQHEVMYLLQSLRSALVFAHVGIDMLWLTLQLLAMFTYILPQ